MKSSQTTPRRLTVFLHESSRSFSELSPAERIGFLLLLATIIASPIPWGGIMPGGGLRIQVLSFLTAAIAVVATRGSVRLPRLSLLAITGVALLGALQLIAFPENILAILSPESVAVYRDANQILSLYGRPEIAPRISIVPSETVRAGLFVMSYVFTFIAGALLCRTRFTRNVLVGTLLLNGIGHVIFASIIRDDESRLRGTFVNANHFAGYLEIALALAFAMVWLELVQRGRTHHGEDSVDVMERRFVKVTSRILAWAIIGAGVAFTSSRMGIVAAALATVTMLLLGLAHREAKRRSLGRGVAVVGVLAAGVALILMTTGRLPFLRFIASDTTDPESNLRFQLWQISLDAWRNYPHFGSGLGTFREAFRAVQPQGMNLLVEQAHNDTLQLLVTGGWVGASLAVFGIVSFFILLIRRWWKQARSTEAAFALGGIGALTSLLLHGIVEFNFSVPAIPLTLACFLGAAWTAANSHNENGAKKRSETSFSTGGSPKPAATSSVPSGRPMS